MAGDVRLRQARRRGIPAAAGRPAPGAVGHRAQAHARGAAGQRRNLEKEARRLRGRRPHRAGEPRPDHHLLRVRAGGRREGRAGGEPRRRSGPRAEGGQRAHRGPDSRTRHRRRGGAQRRVGHRLPARDLRLRGVRRVQGQAAAGPRQGRQRHAGRGRPHRDAAPARGRRHRQRQVGRPELDDLLDPVQGDARRRALPHGGSQAARALGVRGHSASAVAGGHRRQGGGRPATLDRRQDGRALQGAAAQAGAQYRGLQQGRPAGGEAAVLGRRRRRAGRPDDGLGG